MTMSNNGISKLVEESGELQQVLGKILAYGLNDHPDGKGNLLERFEEESADVMAAIIFVQGKLGADPAKVHARSLEKLSLYRKWDGDEAS